MTPDPTTPPAPPPAGGLLLAVDDDSNTLRVPLDGHRSLVQRWREAKERVARATEEAKELREEILHLLADDRTADLLAARNLDGLTATVDGSPAAVLKYTRTNRFDRAAAARENPDFIARHTRLSGWEPRLELAE